MGSVLGSAFGAGVAVLVATLAAGPGLAATIGFSPERAICLPAGLTAASGTACGVGIEAAEAVRFDGALPASLASAGDARAQMLPAAGLLAAAVTVVGRGAEGWRQGAALGDIPLFRVDVSVLRAGLPEGGPFAGRVPVVNVSGPGPGFDPSDVVFPGEAAARFLLWRRERGRVLEWTGWWGSVLIPFGTARASSVIDADLRGLRAGPATALPREHVFLPDPNVSGPHPAAGGAHPARPVLPAPVPLPGGLALLLAALWAPVAVRRLSSGRSRPRVDGSVSRPISRRRVAKLMG